MDDDEQRRLFIAELRRGKRRVFAYSTLNAIIALVNAALAGLHISISLERGSPWFSPLIAAVLVVAAWHGAGRAVAGWSFLWQRRRGRRPHL